MTEKITLNNGMVAIAVANPTADIMAARIFIGVGSRRETRKNAGITHLLSAVMTKGTDRLTSMDIAEKVESIGANLGTDATPDYFLLSLKTVSADFSQMLRLAGELLRSPTFPEAEIELERRITLQALRSSKEQPMSVAFDRLRHALYGEHPYAFSGLGLPDSVAQLSRDDLLEYHRTYFRPDNIVVSLTGCIAPDNAFALVEEVFGDWQPPDTSLPETSLAILDTQPSHSAIAQETQQSVIMLGYLAPSVKLGGLPQQQPGDYASLKLLNTHLGNGLSSRLFVELREKRGLAYDVSAFFPTRLDPSHFVVYMGTAPENTQIALDELQAEVDRLVHTLLTEEELQTAKNKMLGQYALGKQTNAQIAQLNGWYEMLGLGLEFDREFIQEIAAIEAQQAQQAAQRYFTEPYISIVGPEVLG